MGNTHVIKKINYEDIQFIIKNDVYLLINTLPQNEQKCLIINTIEIEKEEAIINKCLKENKNKKIIIYGKNCNDDTVNKKYQQLVSLGFYNIFIYTGGLFEWLLLQDIYGKDIFPTTCLDLDILKYNPPSTFSLFLLEN
jgi:ADP-glucose pyrophosphorylase